LSLESLDFSVSGAWQATKRGALLFSNFFLMHSGQILRRSRSMARSNWLPKSFQILPSYDA
ncbi:MAG: hypothetical protein DMG30_19070, partial [Acidobacteria bacterium]